MVRRAGWAQITERRDVLAAAAAEAVQRWDGGKAWPVGEIAEFDPASCPAAAGWADRLRPARPTSRRLSWNANSWIRRARSTKASCSTTMHPDAQPSAAPTNMGEVTVYACVPQRISTRWPPCPKSPSAARQSGSAPATAACGSHPPCPATAYPGDTAEAAPTPSPRS